MLLIALATLAAPTPAPPTRCVPDVRAVRGPATARPRRLGEEPDAERYLTVLHRDDKGCPRPVKVRDERRR